MVTPAREIGLENDVARSILTFTDYSFGALGALSLASGLVRQSALMIHESGLRIGGIAGPISTHPLFRAFRWAGVVSMAHTTLRTAVPLAMGYSTRQGSDFLMLGGLLCGLGSLAPAINPRFRAVLAVAGTAINLIDQALLAWRWKKGEVDSLTLAMNTGLTLLYGLGHSSWIDPRRLLMKTKLRYPDAGLFRSQQSTVVGRLHGLRLSRRDFASLVYKKANSLSASVENDLRLARQGRVENPDLFLFSSEGLFIQREEAHDTFVALNFLMREAEREGLDLVRLARRFEGKEARRFPESWRRLRDYWGRLPGEYRVSSREVSQLVDRHFSGSRRLWLVSEEIAEHHARQVRGPGSAIGRSQGENHEIPSRGWEIVRVLREKHRRVMAVFDLDTHQSRRDSIRLLTGESPQGHYVRRFYNLVGDLERLGVPILAEGHRGKVSQIRQLLDELRISHLTPPPLAAS